MKKSIITGATSFIAVPLIESLLKENYYIYGVVRPNSVHLNRLPHHKNLQLIELDMKEIERLPDYIPQSVDSFYHFAWEGIRGTQREDEQLQESNYLCARKAVEAAAKIGTSVFLGSGSQAEYGMIQGRITELRKEHPVTAYGNYKLKAKIYCEACAKLNHFRFIWGRIFSAYGRYDYQGSLIMYAIEKMKRNEELILSACEQKWNYTYVEDIALAFRLLAELPCESGVYNIANRDTRVLKSFLLELQEIMRSSSMLRFGAEASDKNSIVSMEPDAEKMELALNCQLNTEFSSGIRKLLN